MAIVTAKQVSDLLIDVEDFDTSIWTDGKIIDLALSFAQPYFEDTLCNGKKFDNTLYVELYDGTGTKYLRLKHRPISSVISVSFGDEPIDLSMIYNYSYRISCDRIFPMGMKNITVQYTAGCEEIPGDVSGAVACLCAAHIARVSGGGGDALSTGISAGPIELREAFSAKGKYANKIEYFNEVTANVARKYSGVKIISSINKKKSSDAIYDPRIDGYIK